MNKSDDYKECKVICAECKNYYTYNYKTVLTNENISYCRAYQTSKMDCISGKTSLNYGKCEEYNSDGNCKKFEMDKNKVIERNLIKAICEWRQNHINYGTYPDYLDTYTAQLLSGLAGGEMRPLCYFTKEDRMRKYKCQKYD